MSDAQVLPDAAFLVDGNNLLMRCIKAMEYSGLRNGESWRTGPLTAFIGALSRFTRDHRPSSVVVCWDDGPSARRMALYPQYKASRKPSTPEQAERKETAFGMTKTFLEAAGIQQVSVNGFEADDVIAAYWSMLRGMPTVIVSGDKDFFQLLSDTTVQLRPDNAGGYRVFDALEVELEYGCPPASLPLLMALMGDASDGVPGVRGLGPKKALRALQEADWSLGRVRALVDGEQSALAALSLALVDLRNLHTHPRVPLVEPFKPVSTSDPETANRLLAFLRSLEMTTVISKFHTNTLWY